MKLAAEAFTYRIASCLFFSHLSTTALASASSLLATSKSLWLAALASIRSAMALLRFCCSWFLEEEVEESASASLSFVAIPFFTFAQPFLCRFQSFFWQAFEQYVGPLQREHRREALTFDVGVETDGHEGLEQPTATEDISFVSTCVGLT